MNTYKFTSHSSSETMDFAYNLASKLKIGDVIDFGDGGEAVPVEYICPNESGSHFRIFLSYFTLGGAILAQL